MHQQSLVLTMKIMTNWIEELRKAYEQYQSEDYIHSLSADTLSKVAIRLSAIYANVSELRADMLEEYSKSDEIADYDEKQMFLELTKENTQVKAQALARVKTHQKRMEVISKRKSYEKINGLLSSTEKMITSIQSRLKTLATETKSTRSQNG